MVCTPSNNNDHHINSQPNAYGVRKEAVATEETTKPFLLSRPDALSKISQASTFEKVSSGMWNLKKPTNEIEDKTITSTWDESNPIQVPIGLVTRARAKKFKEALNGLIQATWAQSNSWRPVEGIAHDKCMIQTLEISK